MDPNSRLLMMGAGAGGSAAGQVEYTTAGTFSWVAPVGVTSVSVVCVGAGGKAPVSKGCGGGGGLGWKNDISVTPGQTYTVVVGAGGYTAGGDSYFINTSTCRGIGGGGSSLAGGGYVGDGGGSGGNGGGTPSSGSSPGGGGAGGYTGNGGYGGAGGAFGPGGNGAGGAAGGGAGAGFEGGSGGGVGLLGQGNNGFGASSGSFNGTFSYGFVGQGGSGGLPLTATSTFAARGPGSGGAGDAGGTNGAVRIIWPGTTRQFPSTNTADVPV